MTAPMLLFAVIVCVNCCYAAAALAAAARYGIRLSLRRGAGVWVLCAGTLCETYALAVHDLSERSIVMLVAAFGAVTVAAASDAACGYVFDAVTVPCCICMAVTAAFTHAMMPFVLGVAAAGGALFLLYAVTMGRGIGLGDVKLACCIGGAAGASAGIAALGIAFVAGGAYAAALLAARKAGRRHEMPFAPYLAGGLIAVTLAGALP